MAYIRRGLIINVVANEMSITCYLCTRLELKSDMCFGSIRYCSVLFRSMLVRVEILRSRAHTPLYYRSHQDLYTHHCSIQFILYILSSLNLCADSPIPFALSIAHMSLKDFFFSRTFVHSFHSYIDSKHLIAIP